MMIKVMNLDHFLVNPEKNAKIMSKYSLIKT